MKRKIIKLAEKTLVVSLPTSWVVEQGIGKGDEVECTIEDNKLIIEAQQQKSKLIKEIDVAQMSERVLRWNISSLHKQGYDEIIVSGYTEAQYTILQDLLTHLFIGFIVKERSKLRIVIGEVTVVDVNEFDAMLRRAFRLLIRAFEDLEEATSQEKSLQKLIDVEHDNNKVTNFCERLLNKNLVQKEKGHFWYVVAWNLEKVVDNFKYIAQHYKKITLSSQEAELLAKTKEFATGYYECFYDFDFETLVSLSELKKELLSSWLELLETSSNKVFVH